MKNIIANGILLLLLTSSVFGQTHPSGHVYDPVEPEFEQINFLRIPDIPEMNLDYALLWTDSAAGQYSVKFNAAKLASGTYFYSLKTDNYSGTKSVVLVK